MGESLTQHKIKSLDNMTKPRFRLYTKEKLRNLVQSMISYNSETEFDAKLTYTTADSNIATLQTVKMADEATVYSLVLPIRFFMQNFFKNLVAAFTSWRGWKCNSLSARAEFVI